MVNNKILVVEDDESIRFVIRDTLENKYSLNFLGSIRELREELNAEVDYDLILLDLKLCDGNIEDELKINDSLRKMNFIIISSLDDPEVLRSCLRLGASDYLTKPFNANELWIKIERNIHKSRYRYTKLFDEDRLIAIGPKGESGSLTAKEYQIFRCLSRRAGEPVDRNDIRNFVWGDTQVGHKTLDVHLHKLRRKVEPIGLVIRFLAPDSYILCDENFNFF